MEWLLATAARKMAERSKPAPMAHNGMDGADELHSQLEGRRIRIARSIAGRILFVVYTVRRQNDEKEIIRIISTRQANGKERTAYSRLTD
jgi:uncharacterized DUF497 family protein